MGAAHIEIVLALGLLGATGDVAGPTSAYGAWLLGHVVGLVKAIVVTGSLEVDRVMPPAHLVVARALTLLGTALHPA